MTKLSAWKKGCVVILLCAAMAIAAPAQNFTTVVDFDETNGSNPYSSLIQAGDGNLYGTTFYGGAYGYGTIFQLDRQDTLTTMYSLCALPGCTDGGQPESGMTLAADGNFYSTTRIGGAFGGGTVFELTRSGTLETIFNFDGADGEDLFEGLIQATNGAFYGTTSYGGSYGGGTIFKVTPDGALTTLYNFCVSNGCGYRSEATLAEGTDGNFYGSTEVGGAYNCDDPAGCGTIFRVTPEGTLTTLHIFCSQTGRRGCPDGYYPIGKLIQGTNGNFYGTTYLGGLDGGGTVFEITRRGELTTLYNFCSQPNGSDGCLPIAGLVLATDGNFYGTTAWGGRQNCDVARSS